MEDLQIVIRKPCMKNVKRKPQRNMAKWSTTADTVAKWRSKEVRRAMDRTGTTADWEKKRRLDREIKRLVQ